MIELAYVYRFKDVYDKVIYVGYTGQTLDKRIGQHFEKGHLPRTCYNSIAKIEYIKYPTKSDAMIMETYFINKYKPTYNKLNKQNDAITLNLEIKENWRTYKVYKTKADIEPLSEFKGCLLSIGIAGLLLYSIFKFFITIL